MRFEHFFSQSEDKGLKSLIGKRKYDLHGQTQILLQSRMLGVFNAC